MQIRFPSRCPLLVGASFGGDDRFALAIEMGSSAQGESL
jgi:hypothetical protein